MEGKCIHDTVAASGLHLFVHSLAARGQRKRVGGQVAPLTQPKLAGQSRLWLSFPPDIIRLQREKFPKGVGLSYPKDNVGGGARLCLVPKKENKQ